MLNTLCCSVLFICIPSRFIVTSKRYFPPLLLCVFPQSGAARRGHWEGLLAASSKQWPRLGRILHVFPVALSFSMLLSRQLIVRRYQRGSFSQDPQHTATHSDGVTRPSQQSPLCLRPSAQPAAATQLLHILAAARCARPPITDITGGRVCVCQHGDGLHTRK